MEKLIYDSEREEYVNLLEQLQRLREEGKCVYSLEEKTFKCLVECIEKADEARLNELRQELKEICPAFKVKHY